jgi:hypothetical protein
VSLESLEGTYCTRLADLFQSLLQGCNFISHAFHQRLGGRCPARVWPFRLGVHGLAESSSARLGLQHLKVGAKITTVKASG